MSQDDCREIILDDCAKVDFILASSCSFPCPLNAPNIVVVKGATFGKPILTIGMDGQEDGDMDTSPTLQTRDNDTIAGRTRQHTLQCVVTMGTTTVRKKATALANADIVPLLTFADGSQRMVLPLPNTSNFTVTENFQSANYSAVVQLVVDSLSMLVDVVDDED